MPQEALIFYTIWPPKGHGNKTVNYYQPCHKYVRQVWLTLVINLWKIGNFSVQVKSHALTSVSRVKYAISLPKLVGKLSLSNWLINAPYMSSCSLRLASIWNDSVSQSISMLLLLSSSQIISMAHALYWLACPTLSSDTARQSV